MKFYNANAAKKPTSLSKQETQKQWLKENQKAITEYNQVIAKRGVFGDEWKRF